MNFSNNRILNKDTSVQDALSVLNTLGQELVLFIVNDDFQLIGTFTDGDFRRGILRGLNLSDSILKFINLNYIYVSIDRIDIHELNLLKSKGIMIVPLLDYQKRIVKLINFAFYKSYLPLDVVIMAGGEGVRLRPLTDNTPKPMLKVGGKPILEHLIDRFVRFGISNFYLSINYLGNQIKDYFEDGSSKNVSITYVEETTKLGTIGGISQINDFKNNAVLVINSDILTNINLEDFYVHFLENGSDMAIACVPYVVNIPYAVLDTNGSNVLGFKEKPSLNYLTNAGIYLIKKEILSLIPQDTFYNATDLISHLLEENLKVTNFTILDYWLDVGKMDDFQKAQSDILNLEL